MTFEIRRAQHNDAGKIIEAHRRSIREVCSRDYGPEQIAAWSGRNFREDRWQHTIDRDLVWVISDADKNIYGFGHLQLREDHEAEIAGLYFSPEVIGKGFGKKLFSIILDECKKHDAHRIVLSATKTAKAFYESRGFQQQGCPTHIELGGQKIDCFNMEMKLLS